MNGAILNPADRTLIIAAHQSDVHIFNYEGIISVVVENLIEGIEIVHEQDRLWRPA